MVVASGMYEFVLSELLEQLAASRAVRISRQKTKRLRGGGVVVSWAFSLAVLLGARGEVVSFRRGVSDAFQ